MSKTKNSRVLLAKCHNNLANLLNEDIGEPEQAAHHNADAVRLAEALNVGTRDVRVELAGFYNTKGVNFYTNHQLDQAILEWKILEWKNAAKVLATVVQENNKDQDAAELLGMILCNICEVYQQLKKHKEAVEVIDQLANLRCQKSRFGKAAHFMEDGCKEVQDQDLRQVFGASRAVSQNGTCRRLIVGRPNGQTSL